MKAVSGIGEALIEKILANRPYSGIEDFIEKTEVTKSNMVQLIKAGSFDKLYPDLSRKAIMFKYLQSITKKRKQLTVASLPMLAKSDLIIPSLLDNYGVYEFNRYLKHISGKRKDVFVFDERAQTFYRDRGYDEDLLELDSKGNITIPQKQWDKIYSSEMDPVREWLKESFETLRETVFINEVIEEMSTHGSGSVSKWEMDSLCFYHGEHELAGLDNERYGVSLFSELPKTANIRKTFRAFGKTIPIFETTSIAGTVIGKNKVKGSIDLLTQDGEVILVKMNKNKFSKYDRQISEIVDGKKKVVEKSWFKRGNLIMVHGYRRDDQFIPKSYKDTPFEEIYLIEEMDEYGKLKLNSNR